MAGIIDRAVRIGDDQYKDLKEAAGATGFAERVIRDSCRTGKPLPDGRAATREGIAKGEWTAKKMKKALRLAYRTSLHGSEIGEAVGMSGYAVAKLIRQKGMARPNSLAPKSKKDPMLMGYLVDGKFKDGAKKAAKAAGCTPEQFIRMMGGGLEVIGWHAVAMSCPRLEAWRLASRSEEAIRERERRWYDPA